MYCKYDFRNSFKLELPVYSICRTTLCLIYDYLENNSGARHDTDHSISEPKI